MSFFSDVKADVKANKPEGKIILLTFFNALIFHVGFQVLFLYRLQRLLCKIPVAGTIMAKLLGVFSTWISSCHISRVAKLEGGVCLPHATGIVIGDGCVIKRGVTIFQNVTIGLKEKSQGNPPLIQENVMIYTGAVIIGSITVGTRATVGANSVVLRDVKSSSIVVGAPARELAPKQ